MNRYLAVAFLMCLPLYGIRKASEELVKTLPVKKVNVTIASTEVSPTQLTKSVSE